MKTMQPRTFRFEASLTALAEVFLSETGATGFALYQRTPDSPNLTRIAASGEDIPEAALLEEGNQEILAFPLHTSGAIDAFAAFRFADHASSVLAEESLGQAVEAIESLWSARHLDARYFALIRRLGWLESQLIDSKIAERARGALTGTREPGVLDAMTRHVRTVLRPSSSGQALEALVKELENEIEERAVTGRAKAILQATQSLTEEQAYSHLRTLSRKSRRRLREVAQDLVNQYTLEAKTA